MSGATDILEGKRFWWATHNQRVAYLRELIAEHTGRIAHWRKSCEYGKEWIRREERELGNWRDLLARIMADPTWRPGDVVKPSRFEKANVHESLTKM